MTHSGRDPMPTFQLLTATIVEGVDFVRLLAKLARAELHEQIAKAGRGASLGVMAAGGFVLALVFLLLGIVELIVAWGLAVYAAFFLTGGALALLSIVFGLAARANFKSVTLRPELTLEQIRRFSAASPSERLPDEPR